MKKTGIINNLDRFLFSSEGIEIVESDDNKETKKLKEEIPKQNMSLPGFTTTKDLDLQLESILKSIEPEVMAAIKKTKYFDKKE